MHLTLLIIPLSLNLALRLFFICLFWGPLVALPSGTLPSSVLHSLLIYSTQCPSGISGDLHYFSYSLFIVDLGIFFLSPQSFAFTLNMSFFRMSSIWHKTLEIHCLKRHHIFSFKPHSHMSIHTHSQLYVCCLSWLLISPSCLTCEFFLPPSSSSSVTSFSH